jgi:Uri superfamily endonuclease
MLTESTKIRQNPGEDFRRWFSDQHFDLIVWQKPNGAVSTFQLCYNKQTDEHALVWHPNRPIEHYRVDSGEPAPTKNLSPIMVDNSALDLNQLLTNFTTHSAEIDPHIREHVLTTLQAQQSPAILILGDDTPGGVYALRVHLERSTNLAFGRFRGGEPIPLQSGDYLYIGSAHGERGANTLANRLLRHATRGGDQPPHHIRDHLQTALQDAGLPGVLPRQKTVRWHIDYLLDLPTAHLTGVIALRTAQKLEKPLAEQITTLPGTQPVSPGLGASDHPGHTHLFYIEENHEIWINLATILNKHV